MLADVPPAYRCAAWLDDIPYGTMQAMPTIPLDGEPVTAADLQAIEAGRRAFARGDSVSFDELLARLDRTSLTFRRR